MIQKLIYPIISVSQRLRLAKNVLALSLLSSICFTYTWWTPGAYFPKMTLFPFSYYPYLDYVLLGLLVFSLLSTLLYRSPRIPLFIGSLCLLAAVVSDTTKGPYWLLFYLAVLLLLCGHNWRVDEPRRYNAVYTSLKILICLMYVLSAIQFFKSSMDSTLWLSFIAPLENVCTPEQHGYLTGIRYIIPFLELFVVLGLFINRIKMAALVIGILLHLFTFCLLLLVTPSGNAPLLIWNLCMIFLLYFLFAGRTTEQKIYAVSFNLYGLVILLLVFVGGIIKQDVFPENKIDFMQSNNQEQFIYLKQQDKAFLPLYLQYFNCVDKNKDYVRLSVSRWCAHETKAQEILNTTQLQKICLSLKHYQGSKIEFVLSVEPEKNTKLALNQKP